MVWKRWFTRLTVQFIELIQYNQLKNEGFHFYNGLKFDRVYGLNVFYPKMPIHQTHGGRKKIQIIFVNTVNSFDLVKLLG